MTIAVDLGRKATKQTNKHVIKRRKINVDATLKRCIGVNIASSCP